MNAWANEHRALLSALRAQSIIPPLIRRLSLERVSPDDAEVRQLRGWAESLRTEPAWQTLEPVIDVGEAWPAVWEKAVANGFSPRTDHHNALFFQRLSARFVESLDWNGALWAWGQCATAWTAVFASDYPGGLFNDLGAKLADGDSPEELLRCMLDELVTGLEGHLHHGAGLAKPGNVPQIERRRLRFAWEALKTLEAQTLDREDPYGTLNRLVSLSTQARSMATSKVFRRFEATIAELDLTVAAGDTLVGPLSWVADYCSIVGYSEDAVTTVVSTIVDLCWDLRRVGRDEIPEFAKLLKLADPFNRDLYQRLISLDSAFGHNSRCADFLAFHAEDQRGEVRTSTLDAALKVCPNHRNSSMLKSYDLLTKATEIIAEVALISAFAVRLPPARKRVESRLAEAQGLVDEAEATYPYNSKLPDVKEALETERTRLNVPHKV